MFWQLPRERWLQGEPAPWIGPRRTRDSGTRSPRRDSRPGLLLPAAVHPLPLARRGRGNRGTGPRCGDRRTLQTLFQVTIYHFCPFPSFPISPFFLLFSPILTFPCSSFSCISYIISFPPYFNFYPFHRFSFISYYLSY